jgi:hypothetical protein
MTGALDRDRLSRACQAAGNPVFVSIGPAESMKDEAGSGGTPDAILCQRDVIEFLVCELIGLGDHYDYRQDDGLLDLHNALVWRIWQELDVLAMWAGGNRRWSRHSHWGEPCGSAADCARGGFIKACNRLYAEVEPGARIASVEIAVHNADGTEVSYATYPRELRDGAPQPPLQRIIHTEGHEGCIDATVEDK